MVCDNCFSQGAPVNRAAPTIVPGDSGVDPIFGPSKDVAVVEEAAVPVFPLNQQDLVKLFIIAALVVIFSKVLS